MNINLNTEDIRSILTDVIRNEIRNGVGPATSIAQAIDIKDDLRSLKQVVQSQNQQLQALKHELNQGQENFLAENQKIYLELTKTTPENALSYDDNPETSPEVIQETRTVRQILEFLALEVQTLKSEIRQLQYVRPTINQGIQKVAGSEKKPVGEEDERPGEDSETLTVSAVIESEETQTRDCSEVVEADLELVKDIQAKTKEDEWQVLLKEFDNTGQDFKHPQNGTSLHGKSVLEISAAVQSLQGNPTSLTLEIINRTSVPLVDFRSHIPYGQFHDQVPGVVKPIGREVIILRGGHPESINVPEGTLSYRVGSSPTKLMLYFNVYQNGKNFARLAFGSKDFDNSRFYQSRIKPEIGDSALRPDIQFKSVAPGKAEFLVVKLADLRAKLTIHPSNAAIWTLEILKGESGEKNANTLEDERLTLETKCYRNISNGQSFIAGQNTVETLMNFREKRGCLIEIANGLKQELQDLSSLRYTAKNQPIHIGPCSREVFLVTFKSTLEGIFSHQIQDTDLRFAVVFRLTEKENHFAIGFFPKNIPTDRKLLKTLTSIEEWPTRPDRKYASAKNGEQVIEIRNIRARAIMSPEPAAKMLLKIMIQCF